jgi:type II secretory pathway component GspD/PulD (secretin)
LDNHTPGNVGPSAAVMRAYSVPTGNAEAIVKTLKEGYAKNVKIRIEAAGANKILVYAPPSDQSDIAAQLGKGINKPEPKTFAFDMADKPWKHVFEWYADQTGLPFVGSNVPTGTFTFIGPRNKKYTLEEITDILNEALLAQKFILVRRAASFTVLPADEKIDPTLLPRVSLDDLEKRGRTELVTVMMPLKLKANEIAPDVKKLLGPFGSVVVLEKANQLLLQDTAGNLRQICQTIKEIEVRDAGKKLAPEKPK